MEAMKLSILKLISKNIVVGDTAIVSFESMTEELKIAKVDLDHALILLDKEHFITEFPTPNNDLLQVRLNQKGLDAVQGAAQ